MNPYGYIYIYIYGERGKANVLIFLFGCCSLLIGLGVVQAGIAVMGHTGLTPQSVSALGGFRSVGKSAKTADKQTNQ